MLRSIRPGEHAAQGLDAERERGHVEQQHVLDVALQHAGLDGGADGHHLVGVHALMRLAAEEGLHRLDHLRHARHAADEHHFLDLGGLQPGILQRVGAGADGLLDEIVHQALELGARELHGEMLRAGLVGGDEGQVDLGLRRRGELDLRLLRRLFQALQRQLVAAQIDAALFLEFVGEVIDDAHVEVLAAEEGVAVGRLHLEHAVADLEHRDVEGAAAEVIDGDGLALLLLEPVGESGRGRLVDDAQHFEAGDLAGVLGGLALRVVEISGDGDDRLLDLLAEIGFGGLLHLLQDEGGNLRGRILLAVGLDPGVAVAGFDDLVGNELLVLLDHRVVVAAADQALDGEERVLGIGDGLSLGRKSDDDLPVIGEGDHRGRRAHAFGILDDLGILPLHHGDAGIGSAEIDTDHFRHYRPLFLADRPGP